MKKIRTAIETIKNSVAEVPYSKPYKKLDKVTKGIFDVKVKIRVKHVDQVEKIFKQLVNEPTHDIDYEEKLKKILFISNTTFENDGRNFIATIKTAKQWKRLKK